MLRIDPDVSLDRLLGQAQPVRDRHVRPTLRHQLRGHPAPAGVRSSSGARGRARPSSVDTTSGSTTDPPTADPPDGIGEFGEVGDPVLEQVSHAFRRIAQEIEHVAGLDDAREDEDADARSLRADADRRVEALGGSRRRHPHVDDRHVRLGRGQHGEQPVDVTGLADDVEICRGQRRGQGLAQQDRIVGEDYAHGMSARIVVPSAGPARHREPPAGCGDPVIEPPDARSPTGVRPADAVVDDLDDEDAVASVDVRRGRCVARAYLATLVSASATTK